MRVALADISFIGEGLVRPECVLATSSGDLFTADWRGGVAHLLPGGGQRLYRGHCAELGSELLRPNGIALEADGSFLVTHLGAEEGGVFRLTRDEGLIPVLLEVEGRRLPPTNFVTRDGQGRVWVTVSTRRAPRDLAYRRDVADGFIALLDRGGARIVADGLGYTNECQIDPSGGWLWVNETFGRRTSRFEIRGDGLGPRQTVTEYGEGCFPDGLAFDAEGCAWITSIVSNRVIRVDASGRQTLLLEEADRDHLAAAEAAFGKGELGRPHLDGNPAPHLRNISSLAFGGRSLHTAFLGCLLGSQVASFACPVAGWPPPHWNFGEPS
jgi:sugar lactone lactonase YvrE